MPAGISLRTCNNFETYLGRGQGEGCSPELSRPRTAQSFCVPKADIAVNGYDLSINRYKEVVHEQVQHRAPCEISGELARLEDEIAKGMKALDGMLAKEF